MTKLPCVATVLVLSFFAAAWRPVHAGDAAAAKPNTLTAAEKRGGWKLLFDGDSLDGWRNYRKEGVSDGWKAVDGAITRVAADAGDLVTLDEYDSFELFIDYKIAPRGNSGVMFHVTEDGEESWHSGPEIQILGRSGGMQKSGWLYQLYSSDVDSTRPAGEWNQIHLRIAPNQCETHINGLRYAKFVIGDTDWNDRVSRSKFAKYPNFGKSGRGRICLQEHGSEVAFRNIKIRPLKVDGSVPDPVDGELPLKVAVAFPNLKWTGWEPVDAEGKSRPLRPIVLTHAGDGTNRVFVATQQGVIHVFPNDQNATESQVFLDMSHKVTYNDSQDEEGFLGLAFHPDYKKNGEFFAYYTSTEEPQLSVISRFRVSKDDPNRADPEFEDEILRIKQPFWNHNGGTVLFGPDGYLYIALGDGGAANDPMENGQNLGSLLGKILRIDVDKKQGDLNYAIPADNPFANRAGARGENWAYGLRNPWRMAFDRETGVLWAADVGQNWWEEVDLIEKGGNYGWNLRVGKHPFGAKGTDERADLIEPIWEYDHEVGKSMTGGNVYRGKRLAELAGAYLYADYVTGKVFALRYDADQKQIVSNHLIPSDKLPVISFGEDEEGDVYFTIVAPDGRGIYRFERK